MRLAPIAVTVATTAAALLFTGCGDAPPAPTPTPTTVPANDAERDASGAPTTPDGGSAESMSGDRAPAARDAAPTPAPTPSAARGQTPPTDDPLIARFANVEGPKPATWTWQPPASRMYAADYVVPGRNGGNQMHLIVFQGIGGGFELNLQRWVNQFKPDDDDAGPVQPIQPKISNFETVDGLRGTLVEIEGQYQGMGMPAYRKQQKMLMAIVDTSETTLHIRLVGDRDQVDLNREDYLKLLRGLREVGG